MGNSVLTYETRDRDLDGIDHDYERIRVQHAGKKALPMLSLEKARHNKMQLGLSGECAPVKPKFIGRRHFRNTDLGLLAQYIDWAPFFQTWDLAGSFPAILTDPIVGESASHLYSEGLFSYTPPTWPTPLLDHTFGRPTLLTIII